MKCRKTNPEIDLQGLPSRTWKRYTVLMQTQQCSFQWMVCIIERPHLQCVGTASKIMVERDIIQRSVIWAKRFPSRFILFLHHKLTNSTDFFHPGRSLKLPHMGPHTNVTIGRMACKLKPIKMQIRRTKMQRCKKCYIATPITHVPISLGLNPLCCYRFQKLVN